MSKSQKPGCEKVVLVQERDLRAVQGGVDNPSQTPMKDGPS